MQKLIKLIGKIFRKEPLDSEKVLPYCKVGDMFFTFVPKTNGGLALSRFENSTFDLSSSFRTKTELVLYSESVGKTPLKLDFLTDVSVVLTLDNVGKYADIILN